MTNEDLAVRIQQTTFQPAGKMIKDKAKPLTGLHLRNIIAFKCVLKHALPCVMLHTICIFLRMFKYSFMQNKRRNVTWEAQVDHSVKQVSFCRDSI